MEATIGSSQPATGVGTGFYEQRGGAGGRRRFLPEKEGGILDGKAGRRLKSTGFSGCEPMGVREISSHSCNSSGNRRRKGRRAIAQLERPREARIELQTGLARTDRYAWLRSAPSAAKVVVLTNATLSPLKRATAHPRRDQEKAPSGPK